MRRFSSTGELMKSARGFNVVLAVIITLAVALAMPVEAQDGTTAFSTLSEELAPLELMLGTWNVTEILESGPTGRGGKGTGSFAMESHFRLADGETTRVMRLEYSRH